LIARFLSRFAPCLRRRDLFGVHGIYLSRFTLARLGAVRVYLNRFHRGDEDLELHDHPWRWAVSLILSGGYTEERRDGVRVSLRVRVPGNLNVILGDTFHRIASVQPDTWTLFVAGPRAKDWGFWNRVGGTFTPWRDFLRTKGLSLADEGWSPKASAR
jgi:hypothetical protein